MKKKLFIKIVSSMLVCFTLFAFAGCVPTYPVEATTTPSTDTSTPEVTTKPDLFAQPTKITILSWWDATSKTALKLFKANFEGLHPNAKIEYTRIPGSMYADKV